jgi:hypothetical protein
LDIVSFYARLTGTSKLRSECEISRTQRRGPEAKKRTARSQNILDNSAYVFLRYETIALL